MVATLVEIGYFLSTLIGFYGYLVPTIGAEIKEKCTQHRWCNSHLKKSSLGYNVDLSDGQWREFRDSLPLLCGVALLGLVLHALFHRVGSIFAVTLKKTHFHLLFGCIVIFVQHGYHSGVVILILSCAFFLAKSFRYISTKYFLGVVYSYAILIILLKESYRVQHFPQFGFLRVLFDKRYSGLYSWNVPANFLVLRIVSFMLDWQWATIAEIEEKKNDCGSTDDESVHPATSAGGEGVGNDITPDLLMKEGCSQKVLSEVISERAATSTHCDMLDYTLVNFVSYCLYAPLYIGGPVITFNAYIHYSKHPQQSVGVVNYALRWLFAFCLMEVGTSYFPFFAIIKSGLFKDLSAPQLAVLTYGTLKLMWLKFLLLWRFFRLWALADGILPPENQVRCMSNNQSISQFWKGWHASFNLWLVRYLYVPLGGRSTAWISVWPIFLFVAVWHDIEPKLLLWGLLNSGFYVIEMLARRVGESRFMEKMPKTARKCLETVGAAAFILVLIAVNMTGYAVGGEGVHFMVSRLLTREGAATVFWSFYLLSSGVCIMNFLKENGLSK